MKFKLTRKYRKVRDEDIIRDLKKIALKTGKQTVSTTAYREMGEYSLNSINQHFGSWNNALQKAGLEMKLRRNITNYELFFNLRRVWLSLGRQPMRKEVTKPLSKIEWNAYHSRFGSFSKALEEFIKFSNRRRKRKLKTPFIYKTGSKQRTMRIVNVGLRYKVLLRDGYKCVKCGNSPAYGNGVHLQIDHIRPYSKGGETVFENLQTLCNECNLGKSNNP